MSSILSALHVAAGTLGAYDQALVVTQNNVANSSTPGFVAQTQTFYAMPFDISNGLIGGARAGQVTNARDQFAEQAVWQQNTLLGQAQQGVNSLTSLQSYFDITGNSGISKALNDFNSAVSAWGQTPTDTNARQTVLNQAGNVASAFQQTATNLAHFTQNTQTQLGQTVDQINQLTGQLQGYNLQILRGDKNDAGLDAQVYSTLEQLSQYVNFTASKQPDGSITVLADGQVPMLMGSQQYKLTYQLSQSQNPTPTYADGQPTAQILSSAGTDITNHITSGQLGSLLTLRNTILPSYIGDAYQQGSLNTLAQTFADRVNHLLTTGNISDATAATSTTSATPAVTGVPLFAYALNDDGTPDSNNIAQSLVVSSTITASQLAAIQPGPPEVANGVPLALANLANPLSLDDEITGVSFTQYYANMASLIGTNLNNATDEQQVRQSSLAQAQNLRQQQSGVSLDQQAMTLVQFQSAYEANSKLITILDQLTQDTINMMSGS